MWTLAPYLEASWGILFEITPYNMFILTSSSKTLTIRHTNAVKEKIKWQNAGKVLVTYGIHWKCRTIKRRTLGGNYASQKTAILLKRSISYSHALLARGTSTFKCYSTLNPVTIIRYDTFTCAQKLTIWPAYSSARHTRKNKENLDRHELVSK